jgi:hypothetical protein
MSRAFRGTWKLKVQLDVWVQKVIIRPRKARQRVRSSAMTFFAEALGKFFSHIIYVANIWRFAGMLGII